MDQNIMTISGFIRSIPDMTAILETRAERQLHAARLLKEAACLLSNDNNGCISGILNTAKTNQMFSNASHLDSEHTTGISLDALDAELVKFLENMKLHTDVAYRSSDVASAIAVANNLNINDLLTPPVHTHIIKFFQSYVNKGVLKDCTLNNVHMWMMRPVANQHTKPAETKRQTYSLNDAIVKFIENMPTDKLCNLHFITNAIFNLAKMNIDEKFDGTITDHIVNVIENLVSMEIVKEETNNGLRVWSRIADWSISIHKSVVICIDNSVNKIIAQLIDRAINICIRDNIRTLFATDVLNIVKVRANIIFDGFLSDDALRERIHAILSANEQLSNLAANHWAISSKLSTLRDNIDTTDEADQKMYLDHHHKVHIKDVIDRIITIKKDGNVDNFITGEVYNELCKQCADEFINVPEHEIIAYIVHELLTNAIISKEDSNLNALDPNIRWKIIDYKKIITDFLNAHGQASFKFMYASCPESVSGINLDEKKMREALIALRKENIVEKVGVGKLVMYRLITESAA